MSTAWTAADLCVIRSGRLPEIPEFRDEDCNYVLGDFWMWDFWPAEVPDGRRAEIGGGELWFALSSPKLEDPDARHDIARIRMIRRSGGLWTDLGPAFPDNFTPGSREWSGSAIVDNGRITLYFTAAGRRGEAVPTFEQRIFASSAPIDVTAAHVGQWTLPTECFASDGIVYAHAREVTGGIGTIKAFRDPAWFRDPLDGGEYIAFTGSLADPTSAHVGCIGLARRENGHWVLLEPIVTAHGVNNELERPHVRVRDGRYYLFWSTQAQVFANRNWRAPTGLYAMDAASVLGPFRPIGTSALVAANPDVAPSQAYSWWVGRDGEVSSFADRTGPQRAFQGKLAPMFTITLPEYGRAREEQSQDLAAF